MKKSLFVLMIIGSLTAMKAQTIDEALQYSSDLTTGTARFSSMSGAFGALGGDLSAIAINPAGSAVFLNNMGTFSLAIDDTENSANYFNTVALSSDNSVNVNQLGGVFVFDSHNEDSNWKKVTVGVNYNRTQNFDNQFYATGIGNASIANFFLERAQGTSLSLLSLQAGESVGDLYTFLGQSAGSSAQNAFLGYQGFIVDPLEDDPDNTSYVSNVAGGSFGQEYLQASDGYAGKYTFNIGAQYRDHLYFGLNLNSHVIDYNRSTIFAESNNNGGSIEYIQFENTLSVEGAGFSAQLGAISKLNDHVRVGLTYDTPTWFTISEETSQYLETDRNIDNQVITEVVNPQIINIYENYELRTPGKFGVSAAYIFGQDGLLSIDYSYKDYSNIEFKPKKDPFFNLQNDLIASTLKGASTINLGGEYRINQFSIRGGLSYVESPYKDDLILGDRNGYSLGLGYNFGSYHFDIAYITSEQNREQQLYNTGLSNNPSVETTANSILFTLGVNL